MLTINLGRTDRARRGPYGLGAWPCVLALAALIGGCAEAPETLVGHDGPIVVVQGSDLSAVPAAAAPAALAATMAAAPVALAATVTEALPVADLPTAAPVLEVPPDVPISEEKRTDPFHLADVSLDEIVTSDVLAVS